MKVSREYWLCLCAGVLVVYSPSLSNEFLSFDDDWLIRDNVILQAGLADALPRILGDLSASTRDVLGSEYLPVRDVAVWLQLHAFGINALPMRCVSLALYMGSLFPLGLALRAMFPTRPRAVAASLALFALHPVHVESVAWLASQKDLLALLFCSLALWIYLTKNGRWLLWVPIAALCACLSKGISIVLPLLLWLSFEKASPGTCGKPARIATLAATTCVCAAVFAVQYQLGTVVNTVLPTLGGSRLNAALTMGRVFWTYLRMSVVPIPLSVVYETQTATPRELDAWLWLVGVVAVLGVAVWCAWAMKRRAAISARRAEAAVSYWFLVSWFVACLLPVSQVLVSLPNVMADRYLLLAVLAPCVALTLSFEAASKRVAVLGVGALCLCFAGLTAQRAHLFGDPVLLFQDATNKTQQRALGPYQLGLAHERAADLPRSEAAYREAIARGEPSPTHCKAVNNLSYLLSTSAREPEAAALLLGQYEMCQDNPRTAYNLAELLARRGDHAAAKERFLAIIQRFPDYQRARDAYTRRYGLVP